MEESDHESDNEPTMAEKLSRAILAGEPFAVTEDDEITTIKEAVKQSRNTEKKG